MEKSSNLGLQLLRIAGEAIVGAIEGCAELLNAPGSSSGRAASAVSDAINRFGPLIVARWAECLNPLNKPDQDNAIQQLAALSTVTSYGVCAKVMNGVSAAASAADKKVAVEYLAAIPTTTRSALYPDPESGQMVADRFASVTEERILLRLLPINAPPFTVGTDLADSPYRLEQLLGSGGFGVVYKASNRFEQNTPPRALKFCLNRDMVATLQREQELLNRLLAAGSELQWSDRIVKLHGHNLSAAVPFLVYEYISGGSLISRLAALRKQTGQNLRATQVLGLIRRICEPIAFAHTHGLVHRDIKPSNILVSGNTIKLADFGIGGVVSSFAARSSQIGSGRQGELSVSEKCSLFRGAGTPLYMSPEQRQGDPPEPRHDIYSIGVMWYQLLIGDFTRELHTGWADELADEYDAPQKQIDLIQQCVGYLKKRPATARELLEILPSPTLPQLPTTRSDPVEAVRVLGSHDGRVSGLVSFRDSRRLLSTSVDGIATVWDVESGRQLSSWRPSAKSVVSVTLSPDNRQALFGCEDRNAWLWDLARGSDPRCLAGHVGTVYCGAFSPDGRRVVTGSKDSTIRLWHVASGRELLRIEEERQPVTGIAFTPDGLFIVSCSEGGALRIWDSETGWEAQELTAQGGWFLSVAVSPDGRKAACGGKDSLALWSLENGQMLGTCDGHSGPVTSIAFSANGQWLLSGSLDKTIRIWDAASRRQLHLFEPRTRSVNAVAFSADGRFVYSAGDDKSIRQWAIPRSEANKV